MNEQDGSVDFPIDEVSLGNHAGGSSGYGSNNISVPRISDVVTGFGDIPKTGGKASEGGKRHVDKTAKPYHGKMR